jgi:hypothetical protein
MSSTIPTRPGTTPPVDEETRRVIEQRLATAEDESRQDAREAIEEIRRKLQHPSPN